MTKFACTIAAVAAFATAGAASAQTVRASYGDLDLSRASGARTFKARVTAAARDLCPGTQRGELRTDGEHQACMLQARDALTRALPPTERAAYAQALAQRAPTYVQAAGAPAAGGARAGG